MIRQILLIADDLTGSVDTGALFVSKGHPVRVFVQPQLFTGVFSGTNIVNVNAATRSASPKRAAEISREIASAAPSDVLLLKKMDMGLRGNPGAEISALARLRPDQPCFIMPSVPEFETYTLAGHQYVMGKILPRSMYAQDPTQKPTLSYIPDILRQQSDLPICSIPLDELRADPARAVARHAAAGARLMVLDSVKQDDCVHYMRVLQPLYPGAIWAGTLGLMRAVAALLPEYASPAAARGGVPRCAAFTASVYPATKKQLEYSCQHGLKTVVLNMDPLIRDPDAPSVRQAVDACLSIGRSESFLLFPRLSPHLDYPGAERLILRALSDCAREICSAMSFDRLVIIGGETSHAILSALHVESIDLTGMPEVSISVGRLSGGPCDGWEFAAKGGSVGSEQALDRMLGRVPD